MLNQIFTNLFEKKLDSKYNFVPEALTPEAKPAQIAISTVAKIE